MSCRAAVQRDYGATPSVSDDQIATFLDLARQRDEATFKELARCLGVRADMVNEFWMRTVIRAGLGSSRSCGEAGQRRRR